MESVRENTEVPGPMTDTTEETVPAPAPVIPDEEIDAAVAWSPDDGEDTLTPIAKRLEHLGAKFPPGFFDQPIEDVREGLKKIARDKRVISAARREEEARARQKEETKYDRLFSVTRGGRISILYPRLAEVIHQEMNTISFNDALYTYSDGFYSKDKGQISASIKEILDDIGYTGAFSVVKREVVAYLLAENPQGDKYPFNKCAHYLPVNNGVVHVDPDTGKIELLPHDPKYRFSYKLPVTFNPAADATYIKQVIEQWVEPDDVQYLLQVPAVAILQMWGYTQKQMFLFEGRRDVGKTTYCEFLYGFFGDGGYSQVDLKRLTEDRFATAELVHKMANIFDEMKSVALKSIETAKNLSGGKYHRIEKKFENAYNTILPAVHLFTCNVPPMIKAVDDDAFWSRWVYVVFPNRFQRDDRWKATLLTEENYSAFLNLALDIVAAVMQDPAALKRMTEKDVKEKWLEAANDTIRFVWTHFDSDPESIVLKDDVYRAYVQYCKENKISARAKNTFSSDLSRIGIFGVRPRDGKGRVQAYGGIRWKDPSSSGQGGQGIFTTYECSLESTGTGLESTETVDRIRTIDVVNNPDHPDHSSQDSPDPATEAKSRCAFSPDPADYAMLRPPEFRQSCTRCGGRPVVVRERAAEFNRRRGTAALCAKCYAGILHDPTQAEPAGAGVEEAGP